MRLLVTRPREDAARFVAALEAAGHTAVTAPLLEIEIRQEPPDLHGVQALLFTSANGVRAFVANAAVADTAVADTAVADTARRELPVFAVGERTAAEAGDAGFADVRAAAGDVEALAALVRAELRPQGGALLHVAGSSVAGDLAGALAQQGFEVRRAVLYDARPVASLPEAAVAALRTGGPGADSGGGVGGVGFFSPRTARSFVRLVRAAGLSHTTEGLTAFCLSPTVAEAARALTWRDVRVAENPTQEALLAEIGGPDRGDTGESTYGGAPYAQGSEEDSSMAEEGETPRKPEDEAEAPATDQGGAAKPGAGAAETGETAGSVAETVIARFGGLRPTATKLGVAVSTVQGWKARGHIPQTRHEEVRAAAAEHGIDISDLDLSDGAESGAESGAEAGAETPASTDLAGVTTSSGASPWDTRSGSGAPSGSAALHTAEGDEGAGASGASAGGDESAGDPHAADVALPSSAMPPPPPPKGGGGALALGLFLAIVLFVGGAVAAAYTRDIWEPYLPEAPDGPLQQQLAGLEQRVGALESAPAVAPQRVEQLGQTVQQLSGRVEDLAAAPAGPDAGALEALQERVAALEAGAAGGAAGTEGGAEGSAGAAQVQSLRESVAELRGTLDGLRGQLDEQADAQTVETLQQQVSGLSEDLRQVSEQARQAAASRAGDSGFALALGQLRDALRFSEPFATELQAVRGLMPSDDPLAEAVAPLAEHAETGVPTREELRARFEPMARAVVVASYDESWSGRLMSRVSEAVSVRPVGDVEGDSARARVARADNDLMHQDLAGAVEELQGLEGDAAAAAAAWVSEAQARLAAEQALSALTRRTLERLTPNAAAASE
jgi:uroporphyrinogen-III synthase